MTQSISNLINTLDNISPGLDDKERTQVIRALRSTLERLQTPFERAWEMIIIQPMVYAACQTGVHLGLWEGWRTAGGGQKSLVELVELCKKGCDQNLLRRLMRILTGANVVEETGPDRYQSTPLSLAMGERSLALSFQFGSQQMLPTMLELPSYLAQNGFQEPTDAENTVYINMGSNPEKLAFFARCRGKPEIQESFVALMANLNTWKRSWTDYFDTSTLVDEAVIKNGAKTPILVDVGGNAGVDIARFLDRHPDVPAGSVILQDVPDVIAIAKVDSRVRPMVYDFFTPQTVLGSRIYFMHAVLHDWADPEAIQILRNLGSAFTKGYSRLLITDVVIPPEGASSFVAGVDLLMMAMLAGGSRTEAAWVKLLNSAGFKLVKVWKDQLGIECVIEAELADD
ncbi:putative O-methyltransferase [Mycena sanguinolenta]|nr:putative O-methyltransferase [Mycena sanguinolenta]